MDGRSARLQRMDSDCLTARWPGGFVSDGHVCRRAVRTPQQHRLSAVVLTTQASFSNGSFNVASGFRYIRYSSDLYSRLSRRMGGDPDQPMGCLCRGELRTPSSSTCRNTASPWLRIASQNLRLTAHSPFREYCYKRNPGGLAITVVRQAALLPGSVILRRSDCLICPAKRSRLDHSSKKTVCSKHTPFDT